MSERNEYNLPPVFCKIGVFYTGETTVLSLLLTFCCSPGDGLQRHDPLRHLLRPVPGRDLPPQDQSNTKKGQVRSNDINNVFLLLCKISK